MAITPRCAFAGTYSTGASSLTPIITGLTNCGLGASGTAPAVGDLVFVCGSDAGADTGSWSQTAGTGTWTIKSTDQNTNTQIQTSFIAWKIWAGTETAPTFAPSSAFSGRIAYSIIAIAPDTGYFPLIDVWATDLTDASSTSHTPNAATAAGTGELSLIFDEYQTAAKVATAITQTPSSGWTQAAAGGTAGTNGTAYGTYAVVSYKQNVSGTVTPGAETWSVAGPANIYHVLVREVNWGVLQSVMGASSTATTCTATYTSNLSSGSKLIAVVTEDINTTFYPTSVALNDTNATALVRVANVALPSTTGGVSVWVVDTPADAVGTKPIVTATLSGNFGSIVGILEVAGLATGTTAAAVIDGTYGTNTGTATPATSGAYSDAIAGEMLLAVAGDPGDNSTYTLTGYTTSIQSTANTAAQLAVGWKASAGTSESFSWAQSASGDWGTILFAFKPAAGSPAVAMASSVVNPGKNWKRHFKHRQQLLVAYAAPLPPVTVIIPLGRPARARLPVIVVCGDASNNDDGNINPCGRRTNSCMGTAQGTGPPPIPIRQPVRSRIPAPVTARAQVIGVRHAGIAQGTGPPVPAQDGSCPAIKAYATRAVRYGRWLARTSLYQGVGPPVPALRGPPQARRNPFSKGRAYQSALPPPAAPVFLPPLYPLQRPVRAPLPGPYLHGRAYGRAGVSQRVGPPAPALHAPLRARANPYSKGRCYSTPPYVPPYAPPTPGPPIYPFRAPVQAKLGPVPVLHGRAAAIGPLLWSGLGPPVTPLKAPVKAQPQFPYRSGRAYGISRGTYAQVGPPVYPLPGPLRARLPGPYLHGRSASRSSLNAPLGPPVPQLRRPVRARPPLGPHGRFYRNAGVSAGLGPPPYPLHRPVKGQPAVPFRKGRSAGVIAQPPTIIAYGPPIYPLPGPVGLGRRAPGPFVKGRAAGNKGIYVQVGPPLTPLKGPVHAVRPGPYLHGRGITGNKGTHAGLGPPPIPLRAPVKAKPQFPYLHGRYSSRAGASGSLGPPVYPLPGPIGLGRRAPGPYLHGRAYHSLTHPPVFVPVSGSAQPQPTRQPRRTSARVIWLGTVVRTVNAPFNPGPAQSRQSPRLPRRYPSRILWHTVTGPANAHGGNGVIQPRATIAVPRRTHARLGLWQGIARTPTPWGQVQPRATVPVPRRYHSRALLPHYVLGPVNAHGPNGTTQPRAALPVPRRYPARSGSWRTGTQLNFPNGQTQPRATIALPRRPAARAVWRHLAAQARYNGQVQPRATLAVPRRYPSRAVWRKVIGINAHGPSGTAQPWATRQPRRTVSRAVIRFIYGPANAHGPKGTAPLHMVVARRTTTRGFVRFALGRANAHASVSGTVQPKATRPLARRAAARVVVQWRVAPSNAHGPAGSPQPRATIALPRRAHTRAWWRGTAPTRYLPLSAGLVIAFNVQQVASASLVIAFNVGGGTQSNERMLPNDPWISPFDAIKTSPNDPWISPYDGSRLIADEPRIYTQGGN